jgi:ankyrin repeat protein
LIIAPRYWESLPARKESAAAQTAQVSVPASEPATVQQAPLQLAPSETSAPKAESAAPAPILEQSYAASSKDAGRTSDAIAQSSPPAPSRPAPSTRAAGNSLSESADRMFKRTQIPATLQSAAKSGDAVLAAKLLDEGATVNVRDAHGQTPLMLAVEQGQLDVVRLLLQRGADPNATDDTGRTPLQKAKLQNLKEIETLLEGAGAR